MKPFFAANVRGNLVVTVQTQTTLLVTREGHMALAAFLFGFGMSTDHRTRHDEAFPVQGTGSNRYQRAYQQRAQSSHYPLHYRYSCSVKMHGKNVEQAGEDHHHKEWHMHDMPE